MTEISQWTLISYTGSRDKFCHINMVITGCITKDPRFDDGSFIITSRIISANNKSVITENGSHYLLTGEPEPGWLTFCTDNGWDLDPNAPFDGIKLKIE